MYVSGVDPHTKEPLPVARGLKERSRQRALLFYWKKEEAPHVREALQAWGRTDLIGHGPDKLVPPGPAWGSWTKPTAGRLRYDTHAADGAMGAQIERASAEEEAEQAWEAVAATPCG
jgi:hypothetical protein